MSKDSIAISAFAAIGNQRQIGKDNKLLWNIPEDQQRFKEFTSGKAVIMGRRTWESLPESVRPLPNRENIVLTRDEDYEAPGGVVKHNLDEAIDYAKQWSKKNNQDEIFIIGGAKVYEQALPKTEKLYLTLVDSDKDGDTFFPAYKDAFIVINKKLGDQDSELSYTFTDFERA